MKDDQVYFLHIRGTADLITDYTRGPGAKHSW